MSFTDTFRDLVIPRLRHAITINGARVAAGSISYSDAAADTMRSAARYGAIHLPDSDFHRLEDFIASELLRTITIAERMMSDINRHGITFVAEKLLIANDPALTTIFATIDTCNG